MTDKQINKFSDITFTQLCGYDLVATFNNNNKIKELQEQLKAEEQECERLKEQLMQKSEVDMFFNTPIEGWSNDPCGICRYKQTLTEIKEIAEKLKNFYEELGKCEDLTVIRLKQILQKISECEDKND